MNRDRPEAYDAPDFPEGDRTLSPEYYDRVLPDHLKERLRMSEIEKDRQEELAILQQDAEFDPTKYAPGTFSYHEALHTSSVVLDTFDRNVFEHPAITVDSENYRLAQEAHDALWRLYQHLGIHQE